MKELQIEAMVVSLITEYELDRDFAETAVTVFELVALKMQERDDAGNEVAMLESRPRCCGTLSGNHAVHTAGAVCPLHGKRQDGKRLRKYVAVKDKRVVREAIGLWVQWSKKNTAHKKLCSDVGYMKSKLESVSEQQRRFGW